MLIQVDPEVSPAWFFTAFIFTLSSSYSAVLHLDKEAAAASFSFLLMHAARGGV
jgi:hypothetical protein